MTVGRLESEMAVRELMEWLAYDQQKAEAMAQQAEANNAAMAAPPAARPRRPGQSGNLMEMTADQALHAFGFGGR